MLQQIKITQIEIDKVQVQIEMLNSVLETLNNSYNETQKKYLALEQKIEKSKVYNIVNNHYKI